MKVQDVNEAHRFNIVVDNHHLTALETRDRVTALASDALIRDGYIRLGAFCKALQQGTRRIKYGAQVSPYWPFFRGLSADSMWALHEWILFQLDQRHGPLVCVGRNDGITWGVAQPRCENCDSQATRPSTLLPGRELLQMKIHPDWYFKRAGKLPDTTWTISKTRTAHAA